MELSRHAHSLTRTRSCAVGALKSTCSPSPPVYRTTAAFTFLLRLCRCLSFACLEGRGWRERDGQTAGRGGVVGAGGGCHYITDTTASHKGPIPPNDCLRLRRVCPEVELRKSCRGICREKERSISDVCSCVSMAVCGEMKAILLKFQQSGIAIWCVF